MKVFVVTNNWSDEILSVHTTSEGAASAAEQHRTSGQIGTHAGCAIEEFELQP